MPIGRPKKDLSSSNNSILKCDLCSSLIYSSPTIIRLPEVTGKASWYRNCKLDKLNLCEKCAIELNEQLDNFILSRNSSLRKFS